MAYEIVLCKYCNSSEVVRYGTQSGRSRFRCKECGRIFKTDYVYRAYEPGVKDQIVDIAMNGGGIRDTARILGIGKTTVISALKKKWLFGNLNGKKKPNLNRWLPSLATRFLGEVCHGRVCHNPS